MSITSITSTFIVCVLGRVICPLFLEKNDPIKKGVILCVRFPKISTLYFFQIFKMIFTTPSLHIYVYILFKKMALSWGTWSWQVWWAECKLCINELNWEDVADSNVNLFVVLITYTGPMATFLKWGVHIDYFSFLAFSPIWKYVHIWLDLLW